VFLSECKATALVLKKSASLCKLETKIYIDVEIIQYIIQNLPRQRSLQELPIQAHTIDELIENRSQLARLLPKG